MDTNQILKNNEKRFVSQTTKLTCATCGSDFKVSNRQALPFQFEKLNDEIGKIWMSCENCKTTYDLGICKHN